MSLHSPFPPLPQPDGYAAMTSGGTIIVPPCEYAKHNAYAVFTADQMRDYALAAITSQQSATQPQAPQGAVTEEPPLIAQLESIAADSSLAHGDRLQRIISTIAVWRKS